jgi:ribosomal-protein-alanine N-acetyltransferase
MRFGFHELRLHRIEARYILGNERSRRVMEKLGMKPEGVSREAMYVKGKYVSVATWAILEEEYHGLGV